MIQSAGTATASIARMAEYANIEAESIQRRWNTWGMEAGEVMRPVPTNYIH